MKVLVTGATGFVGSWVARELLSAGHSVRALVRPTAKLANLEELAVERASGDVLDRDSVLAAARGCDALVHTAGVAHFLPGETQRMYEVNHRGVEVVFGAAHEAGIRRAVITSSKAAQGGTLEPRVLDESASSSAEESGIDYFRSKYRGERAALSMVDQGMEVVALRPVVLLGPGDIYRSSTSTFLGLARRSIPVLVPGGVAVCDVRDVARAHVVALERGRPGEVYLLGGHNFEVGEMARRTCAMAGVATPRTVPFPLALAVAAIIETAARVVGRKTDLSRQMVRAARLYTWVTSAKAERELDYRIRPFEDSLRDTFRFALATGRLRPSTPELEAIAAAASAPTGSVAAPGATRRDG